MGLWVRGGSPVRRLCVGCGKSPERLWISGDWLWGITSQAVRKLCLSGVFGVEMLCRTCGRGVNGDRRRGSPHLRRGHDAICGAAEPARRRPRAGRECREPGARPGGGYLGRESLLARKNRGATHPVGLGSRRLRPARSRCAAPVPVPALRTRGRRPNGERVQLWRPAAAHDLHRVADQGRALLARQSDLHGRAAALPDRHGPMERDSASTRRVAVVRAQSHRSRGRGVARIHAATLGRRTRDRGLRAFGAGSTSGPCPG